MVAATVIGLVAALLLFRIFPSLAGLVGWFVLMFGGFILLGSQFPIVTEHATAYILIFTGVSAFVFVMNRVSRRAG
jgi:hypothetical protein